MAHEKQRQQEPPKSEAKIQVFPANVREGMQITFVLTAADNDEHEVRLFTDTDVLANRIEIDSFLISKNKPEILPTTGLAAGGYMVELDGKSAARFTIDRQQIKADVALQRSSSNPTDDQAFWVAIRNRTNAISFSKYQQFISDIFKHDSNVSKQLSDTLFGSREILNSSLHLSVHGSYAYGLLKFATQIFITVQSALRKGFENTLDIDEEARRLGDTSTNISDLERRLAEYLSSSSTPGVLPYINQVAGALIKANPHEDFEYIFRNRARHPNLQELIWSYWHEEGMLVQTMNAIAMRFQNELSSHNDPLGELEISPLRPLNNIIWGYIQDEHNRLTVRRRDNEYSHHYGLKLLGRAVSNRPVADNRSKFIETFHNLLYRTAVFYREDADTTVIANAFPLLNALKDVHLVMAEGAHNQFGDMPIQARTEMMTMQWMLARPEMKDFLRGRYMVPYQEEWMGAVDSMKKLQGWTDTTISHFNELAVDGERLLLSIRYGNWSDFNLTEDNAKNWVRYWKPELQRYLHGYQAVTGVELMADTSNSRDAAERYLLPSTLLQRRLSAQNVPRTLPAAHTGRAALGAIASGYVELPTPRQRTKALAYRKGE